MATDNLALPEIAAGQEQKELTHNDALQLIDHAITEFHTADFTSADVTLTDSEFREHVLFRASNLSVARALNVPQIKRLFVVDNGSSSDALTVTRGAGTVIVASGDRALIYTDGTADGIVSIVGGSGGGATTFTGLTDTPAAYTGHGSKLVAVNSGETALEFITNVKPFDIATNRIVGKPTASENLIDVIIGRASSLPENFSGSFAKASVAATAETVFDIKKNGVSVGSLTFAAAGTDGTFSVIGGVTFAAGDTLVIQSPGSQDATLAGIAITLVGSRT